MPHHESKLVPDRWTVVHVYVLPVPVTLITGWLWWRWSGSAALALHMTLLPVVFGYVVPGIGTNVLKRWRFHGPWVIGNYYKHHGFVWAANLSPVLLLCFLGTPHAEPGAGTVLRVLVCAGCVAAARGWIYDLGLLRHGCLEITIPGLEGRSPEELANYYVPLCFFTVGLAYALGGLTAFSLFVVDGRGDPAAHLRVWLVGFGMMALLPALAFEWRDRWRGKARGGGRKE